MGRIIESMKSFFTSDDWDFEEHAEHGYLSMSFRGQHGAWRCVARAREQHQQAIFHSILGTLCPEERRPAMAEFITRVNYGMIIGNFEMDFDDGEIRYKCSIDVEGSELTQPLIKHMVYANLHTMNRYHPAILAVAFGGADPETKVKEIEAPDPSVH